MSKCVDSVWLSCFTNFWQTVLAEIKTNIETSVLRGFFLNQLMRLTGIALLPQPLDIMGQTDIRLMLYIFCNDVASVKTPKYTHTHV